MGFFICFCTMLDYHFSQCRFFAHTHDVASASRTNEKETARLQRYLRNMHLLDKKTFFEGDIF